MKRTVLVIAVAAATVALGIVQAPAARRAPGATTEPAAAPARLDQNTLDTYRVRQDEMTTIRDYYRGHPAPAPEPPKKQKKLPPGLKKKVARGGALPPGWQKKVARGEVMDPMVYEQSRPLPPDLVRTLPPPPAGTVIVTVEGKAVRLLEATRTILDVFDLH